MLSLKGSEGIGSENDCIAEVILVSAPEMEQHHVKSQGKDWDSQKAEGAKGNCSKRLLLWAETDETADKA